MMSLDEQTTKTEKEISESDQAEFNSLVESFMLKFLSEIFMELKENNWVPETNKIYKLLFEVLSSFRKKTYQLTTFKYYQEYDKMFSFLVTITKNIKYNNIISVHSLITLKVFIPKRKSRIVADLIDFRHFYKLRQKFGVKLLNNFTNERRLITEIDLKRVFNADKAESFIINLDCIELEKIRYFLL